MSVFKTILPNDLKLITNDKGLRELVFAIDLVYVKQKLKHRFLLILGEYFADTRLGIPYFQRVLVSNPDINLIRSMFRQVVQESPGIVRVTSMDLLYDKRARTLGVNFSAVTSGGQTLSVDSRVDTAFILSLDGI